MVAVVVIASERWCGRSFLIWKGGVRRRRKIRTPRRREAGRRITKDQRKEKAEERSERRPCPRNVKPSGAKNRARREIGENKELDREAPLAGELDELGESRAGRKRSSEEVRARH